jgi:glutamine synthetase adenylyltransferase
VEHLLQVWEDQQIHSLPRKKGELDRLAKRILGSEANGKQLLRVIQECQDRVQAACETLLYSSK